MLSGWVKVKVLIVKKDVCPKSLQYLSFLDAAEEKYFVHVHAPMTKRLNNPHFCRCIPSCDNSDTNWREFDAEWQSLL